MNLMLEAGNLYTVRILLGAIQDELYCLSPLHYRFRESMCLPAVFKMYTLQLMSK